MIKLLRLGKYNQVSDIVTYNTRAVPDIEGAIDITEIKVPEDVKGNPQNWTFEDGAFREFNDEEKRERDFPAEVYWSSFRNERVKRLAASDWTQVPDAPVDQAAWATYRQALRDLPANTVDPANVNWPEKPS
jgi:hypothetical protein